MIQPQDCINAVFEFGAGIIQLFSIFAALKYKQVKGLSIIPLIFFLIWGFWLLYYYRFLTQTVSGYAAVCIVVFNLIYFFLIIKYKYFNDNDIQKRT
jgi:hypothetical protein